MDLEQINWENCFSSYLNLVFFWFLILRPVNVSVCDFTLTLADLFLIIVILFFCNCNLTTTFYLTILRKKYKWRDRNSDFFLCILSLHLVFFCFHHRIKNQKGQLRLFLTIDFISEMHVYIKTILKKKTELWEKDRILRKKVRILR